MTEKEQLYSMDHRPVADAMCAEVTEDIVGSTGGTVVDEFAVEIPVPDDIAVKMIPEYRKRNVTLAIFPTFLGYYDGGKWVLKIWSQVRLTIYLPDAMAESGFDLNPIRDHAAKFLKDEVTDKMKIKPFRDEDSFRGIFRKEDRGDMEFRLSFFINPA